MFSDMTPYSLVDNLQHFGGTVLPPSSGHILGYCDPLAEISMNACVMILTEERLQHKHPV
jgi:hypothetical protein